MTTRVRCCLALTSLLLLGACASTELHQKAADCSNEFRSNCYPVWFATNRKPIDSANLSKGFGDVTDDSVHYGRVVVPVPTGRMDEAPKSAPWERLTDEAQSIGLNSDGTPGGPMAWERELLGVFSILQPGDQDVVVYIHGFGNTFDQAVEQAANLGATLRVPGVMAMFSWPSQGKHGPLNYLADITAIENSEDELAEFLARLGRLAGPGHVHIIAHSLGVYGFLRSMQSATARAQILEPQLHFGQIIFAALDIDERLFRRLATIVPALANRTTLYVANEDMAVKASEIIHGDHRIGLLPTGPQIGAIDTIEVLGRPSKMEAGHSYFRDAPVVLKDIHTLIHFGESPKERQKRNGFPIPDDPLRSQAWVIHNEN